jgi:hypothetical protein
MASSRKKELTAWIDYDVAGFVSVTHLASSCVEHHKLRNETERMGMPQKSKRLFR